MRLILFILVLSVSILPISGQDLSLFFLGDVNANTLLEQKAFDVLMSKAKQGKNQSFLLLLGGNLYPDGMCNPELKNRREALEARIKPTAEFIKQFPGQAYMIPGVQDWAGGHKRGFEAIRSLEAFITQETGDPEVFYPKNGCPGPEEIELNDKTTLVLLDTQYFLHGYPKGREEEGCGAPGSREALELFQEILTRNAKKHVIVAAHHPVFPNAKKGSLLAAGGKHTSGPRYNLVKKAILDVMKPFENVVWVNSHDYILQYKGHDKNHFITSGSSTQQAKIISKSNVDYVANDNGFSELQINAEGEVKLIFHAIDGESLYEKVLYQKDVISTKDVLKNRPAFKGKFMTVKPSDQYVIGKSAKFWLGKNYRETWSTPVKLPVFDILNEKGGLSIIKKGGGMQTLSIRLEDKNGKQYTLRTVDKDPTKLLPREVRETFAADFLQDQISSSHPYGALVVPKIADAAGVYHTNPKIVYVPDDPAFGEYQFLVADKVFLFEERPTDEVAGEKSFGEGDDIKGTLDLLEKKIYDDNDNWVDQQFVLKSRLFDMLIGDWDRHDDQWRWVGVKDKKGKGRRYRPIPRDRDQAFFVTSGVFPRIGASKWALPSSEGFDEEVDWAPGFNWNMRWFDRTFLTQPDWEDWQQVIKELQNSISEEELKTAVKELPDEVEGMSADKIVKVLTARLKKMETYAREYYEYLSKEVEVVGSNKDEHFMVSRVPNGDVKVTVSKLKKKKEIGKVLFERVFNPEDTKEVRLYGLKGDDVFLVRGEAHKSIKVRVIGGSGDDMIEDVSSVKKGGKKTVVYDTKDGLKVEGGKELRSHLSKDPEINAYNRKSYKYNIFLPLVSAQYNADLGFHLGGGFFIQRFKWRREPYASQHLFLANGAFNVNSYNFKYQGRITNVFGKWGLDLDANAQQPFFISNFFGLGNETEFDFDGEGVASTLDDPIDFYRINSRYGFYRFGLSRFLGQNKTSNISFGSVLRTASVEERDPGFLDTSESGVDLNKVGQLHLYYGVDVNWVTDKRKNAALPTGGYHFDARIERLWGLNSRSENLTRFTGKLSYYQQVDPRGKLILANRVGVEHLLDNDFEFFNSAQLGGWTNIRGFRRNRFSGQTSFYHNVDLRLRLFSFSTYIFPGEFGILGFHDLGRVWVDGESSSEWHFGRGFGVYVAPLNLTAISFQYGMTEEENLLIVKFGFFF